MTATATFVRRLPYLLPLVIFAAIAVYFWIGLGRDPHAIPSALLGKPVPEFTLAPIAGADKGFSSQDLQGQVSLVNVFGSWCVACAEEHRYLTELSRQGLVPIYGIDWREHNREAGPAWLVKHGNPYTLVGDDPESKAAIAFGITGAPETFVVDRKGVIRYRQVGPITPQVWEQDLWPLVRALQAE